MKIAIHDGKSTWSDRWIDYVKQNQLNFEIVNCYSNDIISQLRRFDVLLWHFHHGYYRDLLMARNVLFSAEMMGLTVFPNFRSSWHFDDKVSQKYLLEAVQAPLAKTWVFYSHETAINWIQSTAKFPLVAKLRRGAGSYNVQLIRDVGEALRYAKRMFGKGVNPAPGYLADIGHKFRSAHQRGGVRGVVERLKKAPKFFQLVAMGKSDFPREKSYVYFQEFLPNNEFDTRVTVVGDRAFGVRRFNRKNDFKASASGLTDSDRSKIKPDFIKVAFDLSHHLKTQAISIDFLLSDDGTPRISEVSYGCPSELIERCEGYWQRDGRFIEGSFHIADLIFDDLIARQDITKK